MMTDFRALCAELLDWAEVTAAHYIQLPAVMLRARAALADGPAVPEGKKPTRDELWELWLRLNNELPDRPAAVAEFWEHAQIDARARAALADEPAVPEGREPAAVTEQPNWRGLCEELVDAWLKGDDIVSAMNRARAVLTRWGHHPAPPADGEVAELVAWLQEEADDYECIGCEDSAAKCDRAAELLERQVVVPVPVSERPWEREGWCDAEGRCWWGTPGFINSYTVAQSAQWRLSTPDDRFGSELLCLPAHALPQPEVGE